MKTKQFPNDFLLGFDYKKYVLEEERTPITVPIQHLICVGGSGSGKSTAVLYWIYKIQTSHIPNDLFICDFKKSHEFEGITNDVHFAEFEDCYSLIDSFYTMFQNLPEGGDGTTKILLIDEIAGMLSHFGMTKEGKQKADRIRLITSTILMLGRSRNCYLWLAMQRYTATIFPSASGAADNFQICVGLGRLTVEGRKGLFSGEHFDDEDKLQYGQGKGIVLIDGQPLRSIIIPRVSKVKLLHRLQEIQQKKAAATA